MSSMIDFIVPNIIVGLLVLTIFGVHAVMIDSSVENRVTYDLQHFADTGAQVIHEYTRDLQNFENFDQESIVYTTTRGRVVRMGRVNRELIVTVEDPATGDSETNSYALRLASLQFELLPVAGIDDALLRVRLQTESTPEMEAGERQHRYRAYANRDIYLRNRHLN